MGRNLATTVLVSSLICCSSAWAVTVTPGWAVVGGAVVNENTGAITFCSNYAVLPNPEGTCFKIGTAVPTTTTNTPSLIITLNSTGFYVTNVFTGKVVQCADLLNSQTGAISGSCIAEGTAF